MPPLPPVPRFVRPAQPIGVRVFQPHGQELILESNSRQRGLSHLRVLPEDVIFPYHANFTRVYGVLLLIINEVIFSVCRELQCWILLIMDIELIIIEICGWI